MNYFLTPLLSMKQNLQTGKLQTIGNDDKSILRMTQQLFSAQAFASVERMIVMT